MAGRGLREWSGLGGALFTVLAVLGAILLFDGPQSSSPAKMAGYYGKAGHRTETSVGWVLTGLALFFLLWFVAAVRERIRESEHTRPEKGTLLSTVTMIGGTTYAAVAMAGVALSAGIKTMSDDTYHHRVYGGVIHAAGDATYLMVTTGGVAMAAMIFAVSGAILAFGILPRWVGRLGIAAGIAAIFSIFFFTMIVWLLWVAIASTMLFLRGSEAAEAAPAAAMT